MAERGGAPAEVFLNTKLVPNYASFYGESLMPPSDEGKKLTPEEFQEQFPVRYDVWNTLSQSMLGHSDTGISLNNADHIQAIKTRLHVLNQLDRYITTHHLGENGRTLRGRQMTVFEDIRDHLEQGETTGYIKLPTGSGKTVIFTEIAEATDLKTLIVVPRQLLVDQTANRFKQFAPNMEVGRVYQDRKERGRQVEITTYESMVSGIKNGLINPKDYDLVVLDEVHKGLSQPRRDAMAQFTNAIKLGFTATPNYSEARKVGNVLGKEIHAMTVREAVEEGMLSPFSVYVVKTNTDLTNVKITSKGNYDQDELEKAINNKERNLAAVQTYQALMNNLDNQGKLSIAYCAGVQHAQDLAAEFTQIGVSAGVVYGGQNKNERKKILEDYHNGKIQVLCNARLLIEGFDEPRTGIVLNVAPTASLVDAEQRGGRGLRLDPDAPNKHAIIVDIIDQTSNRRFTPITFAQVVDGAYILPRYSGSSGGNSYPPGDSIKIEIEGVEVTTDPEEVMRIISSLTKDDYAPEEWRNIQVISQLVGVSDTTIKTYIDQIREEHPEWIRTFRDRGNNNLIEHYSEDLIKLVRNKFSEIPMVVPEGWIAANKLAATLGTSRTTMSKYVDTFRNDHPDWFSKIRTGTGRPGEYLSPDLVKLIESKFVTAQPATELEGWVTVSDVDKRVSLSKSKILTFVRKFRDENPEWFKKAKGSSGQTVDYLSPDLVKLIEDEAAKFIPPPEGWNHAYGLARDTNTVNHTIIDIAERYRADHPEWFQSFYNSENRLSHYYSPELVQIIQSELERRRTS